ncbi:MAG: F0F1 ATP synthase subunit A [Magnetococcus sp. WYHC-3]
MTADAAPKMDPLHHFQVVNWVELPPLLGLDVSISNSVVWMWIAVGVVFLFFRRALRDPQVVPGRLQSLAELLYTFVYGVVRDTVGHTGRQYFLPVFALFLLVLSCNWTGLLPLSFTPTSQLVVTATLSLSVFFVATGLGVMKHGVGYLRVFVPTGAPKFLWPLMIPIEIISFLARPVSLAVRLFANMTAGHTVLAVMFFFTAALPWFGAWVPFGFTVVFTGVEIFIGAIQAYIFTILTCVYIHDALHLH